MCRALASLSDGILSLIIFITDVDYRHGDNALSIATSAGHHHLARALKVQLLPHITSHTTTNYQQVYADELPRACLLSAVCQSFPQLKRQPACVGHSDAHRCIRHLAVSLCARAATRERQRLLVLRCCAVMPLVASSFCRRHSFSQSFGLVLVKYCSSALVHQIMRHTPDIEGVLA